jgi:hypothetical protein
MPERWERELDELRHMEMRDTAIRERIERGPSGDRRPPRRDALLAGIVAGAVAIAGVVFLGQLSGDRGGDIGQGTDALPTLLVTFESNRTIDDGSSADEQVRRVDTTIAYGDASESNFTSTTPPEAIVEWVLVDDMTRFVPGPTVGSPVRIEADGEDPQVLIGSPHDWPNFARFTPIERLPDEPGEYVLVFEAEYPEGVARTARSVRIVPRGAVQLIVSEGEELGGAMATAYLDGRRTDGFLSTSSFMRGDVGGQTEPVQPSFDDGSSLRVAPGTPVLLGSDATEARAGLVDSYDDFDPNGRLPIDLASTGGAVDGAQGRHLLAVDVSWRHGTTGYGHDGTEERALFFFPIEIVAGPREDVGLPGEGVSPSPIPSPSPSAQPSDGIVVSVFGLGERSDEMPIASFSYGGETKTACTQDYEWTRADGTTIGGEMPDTSACAGRAIEVPSGTTIAIESATTTRVITTRTTTPFFEGDVGLVVSAEWPEGNATFIVPLTVASSTPDLELVVLDCRLEDQVPISGPDARIEPGGSAYIVGNLPGFEQGDVVEQMTRDANGDTEWSGVWQVVRDGQVVASVDWDALSGTTCRDSGIGGT